MAKYPIDKYHLKIAGSSLDPCVYCGAVANTIDHIEPLSKGGSRGSIQNWAPMCSKCNNNKGNSSVLMAFFHPQLKRRVKFKNRERQKKEYQAAIEKEWLEKQNAPVA